MNCSAKLMYCYCLYHRQCRLCANSRMNVPAGLSWSTILSKRDGYTTAFKHWDIQKIAEMDDSDVERLLQPDSEVVRHRGKILSVIHNAQLVLKIQKEYGSLAAYLWGLMPDKVPVVNEWKCVPSQLHVSTSRRSRM